MEIERKELECGICSSKETDYGFEYYIPTKRANCSLKLCIFCKCKIVTLSQNRKQIHMNIKSAKIVAKISVSMAWRLNLQQIMIEITTKNRKNSDTKSNAEKWLRAGLGDTEII